MMRGAITNLLLIVGVAGALASAEELGVATGSAEHDTPGRALRAGKCWQPGHSAVTVGILLCPELN